MKTLLRGLVLASPIPELMLRRKAARHLTILAYHRVRETPEACYPFDPELISATPQEFTNELRYLRRNLDIMTVRELQKALADPKTMPRRPAVITFDDGYADNYHVAFPLLKEAGVSACFFLSSRIVGTNNIPWWDQVACCFKYSALQQIASPFGPEDPPYSFRPEDGRAHSRRFLRNMKACPWPQALEHLACLKARCQVDPAAFAREPLFCSWAQAGEMAAAGMEIGGHTRTHPVLGQIQDTAILRDEISGGYADIKAHLAIAPTAFSYPEGSHQAMSAEADRIIAEAGFTISFSYLPYLAARAPHIPIRLPRVHLEYGNDFGAFRLGLSRTTAMSAAR